MKKNYRELLAEQVNEKHHKSAVEKEIKVRQQQAFKEITYTPQELNSAISLQLNFQFSQSSLIPTYLLLSVDSTYCQETEIEIHRPAPDR